MLTGCITAIVTPFKSQPVDRPEVDFQALESLVEWQLAEGISGFVVCGTTGETATLEVDEKLAVIKRVISVVNKRVPVIAGTGSNCTKTSIELTRAAAELGADGALVVSPYYNKPTQEGLIAHFSAIASRGNLPVVLYNIPGRTSVDIAMDSFERLVKVPGIVGVKEASGSAEKLTQLGSLASKSFTLLSGEDSLTFLTMCCGGRGVISAASNVIPREMGEIVSRAMKQDFAGSLSAQLRALPMIKALFAETNPAPAKAALAMLGKIESDTLRLPLVSVTSKTRDLIKAQLG